MVQSATVAAIKKDIITLTLLLPYGIGRIWVTAEEIHSRFIHLGVRHSLKLHHVQEALQRNNKDEKFLKTWEYNGTLYYRPMVIHLNHGNELPHHQRYRSKGGPQFRVNMNPQSDYFDTQHHQKFVNMNELLKKLEEEEEAERKKLEEEERAERQRGKGM